MAGHSKFKNIQHRKNIQDVKRAKVFTKIIREIISAIKNGNSDPQHNPRLKSILSNARALNVPKDKIERAIQASADNDGTNYFEARFEGFFKGTAAIIVETLSENKNRVSSFVRSVFTKFGGGLGEVGSASYMFTHVGIIQYALDIANNNELLEIALNLGVDDVVIEEVYIIYVPINKFSTIVDRITLQLGEPIEAYIGWRPIVTASLEEQDLPSFQKLLDALEDSDDVQRVFHNVE